MEALKKGWWKLVGMAIVIALAWVCSSLAAGWRIPDWALLPLAPVAFLAWLAIDSSFDGHGNGHRRY